MFYNIDECFSLQLFAESGAGEGVTGDVAGTQGEETGNADRDETFGGLFYGSSDEGAENETTNEAGEATPPQETTFDDLIGKNGKFREEYEARTQQLIKDRLRSSKDAEAKLAKMQGIVDMLSTRYGVDGQDFDSLSDAVANDTKLIEEKAFENGMSTEQYLEYTKALQENNRLKAKANEQEQKARAERIQNAWVQEAEELKKEYPDFDLQNEIGNEEFAELITKGLPVDKAYKLVHMDDIIRNVTAKTATETRQATVNTIRANGMRPRENAGTRSSGEAKVISKSVNDLTNEEIEKISQLAARGMKITF